MKKALYILSTLLLGLVSCNKAEFEPNEPRKTEETGLVAVTMKVQIPAVELMASTKARTFSEDPQIDYIRVAVFGTSGYPQAYALAEPITQSGAAGPYAETNGDTYYFKVLLPVYDGEAHVHIIANGDESIKFVEQNEESIMTAMKTTDNVGAFWTRVILPNGILPQLDNNGIMQTDTEGNFIPNDETAHLFEELVLVRNFAEVSLSIDNTVTNLHDVTWTLVNKPVYGSVAPMAAGTFVDDYKNYEYNEETGRMTYGSTVYNGFVFSDEPMDYTVPGAGSITTPLGSPNFMYERTHPGDDKATCILMKAKFHNDTDYTYYRIDLMNEEVGGYFPIYRNYKYQVKLHKVGNPGAKTPEEAMNRDSGGNVSMTTEAQKLTDISDGTSRLYVEYVEKNFTSGGKKTLWVRYVPDVTTGTVDNTLINVSIKEQGQALKADTGITLLGTSSDTGYYIYEFELNEQNEFQDLVSKLQVKASNGETGDDKSTLYRDIVLRVIKKMDMTLSLVPKKVEGEGSTTVLNIGLPDNLPSSIFPLEIYIEDVNHTLTPTQKDGNNKSIIVPVKTGKSLADNATSSFYFIRTVNESEYNSNNHTISTQFKTVQDASATTIYVANEYFKTQSINLLNDGVYVNPTNATVAFDVTSVVVEVETEEQTQSWTVSAGNGVTVSPASGQGNGTFTMSFVKNSSTTTANTYTATVTSAGVSHTVTITQTPMKFSVTPSSQEVGFYETTATVTVNAEEGQSWTATVNNGATLTGAVGGTVSGTGSQSLTVNFDRNTATTQKTYTVTATMTDPAVTTTGTIVQGRGPNSSTTLNVNSFVYNNSDYSGYATSVDNYIRIDISNIGSFYGNYYDPTDYGYIQLGRVSNNYAVRGSFTVTPAAGLKITGITVTYTSNTYGSYDTDYNTGNNVSVTVSSGSYSRNGATGTWTGSSSEPVTFNNGYRIYNGTLYTPRITSIQVTYEPI